MSIIERMQTAERTKPFVKWAGGKQALASSLIQYFPHQFHTYYEPFVGGGSVFLTLQPDLAILGDLNHWLIDTYHAIRDNWKAVASILDTLPNTKKSYLAIRGINPSNLDLPQRAAHLIYLNKTCFRGLFRVNQRGMFNVPWGAYDRRYYDPMNLQFVADRLNGIELYCCDFEMSLHNITNHDFAYFDPPYYKLGGYSDFNRYTPDQFRASDHLRLAAFCRELDTRGVRWALSNSDTTFIREIYAGFQIHHISSRREINLNSQGRDITELLITNY